MSNNKYTYEIGKVYGVKQLIELVSMNGKTLARVKCVHCGKESIVRPDSLLYEKTTSCGCLRLIDPTSPIAASETRLYQTYHNMKYRCYTKTANEYENYGGRGITVCNEWLGNDGFRNFATWAKSNGYKEGLSIDRINVNLGYCPENCRWVTVSENTACANRDARVQHRKANKGDYYAIDPNGNMYTFSNANKFAIDSGLKASMIRSSAYRGVKRSKNGWKFGYKCDLQTIEPQSTIESPVKEQVEYIIGETPMVEAPSAAMP